MDVERAAKHGTPAQPDALRLPGCVKACLCEDCEDPYRLLRISALLGPPLLHSIGRVHHQALARARLARIQANNRARIWGSRFPETSKAPASLASPASLPECAAVILEMPCLGERRNAAPNSPKATCAATTVPITSKPLIPDPALVIALTTRAARDATAQRKAEPATSVGATPHLLPPRPSHIAFQSTQYGSPTRSLLFIPFDGLELLDTDPRPWLELATAMREADEAVRAAHAAAMTVLDLPLAGSAVSDPRRGLAAQLSSLKFQVSSQAARDRLARAGGLCHKLPPGHALAARLLASVNHERRRTNCSGRVVGDGSATEAVRAMDCAYGWNPFAGWLECPGELGLVARCLLLLHVYMARVCFMEESKPAGLGGAASRKGRAQDLRNAAVLADALLQYNDTSHKLPYHELLSVAEVLSRMQEAVLMSNGKVGVPSARSLPEHYLSVRAALTLTAVAKHVSHKVIAQHFTSAAAAFVDAGAPSNQLKADWRDSAFLAECSGNLMSYASRKTVEMHFEVLQRVAAELQPLRRQGIAANAAITPAAVVIADATKCEGPCGGDGNVGGDAAVGYAAAANAAAEAEAQLKLPTTFRCRYAVHAAALAEEQAAAVQQRERQLGQQRKQEQRQQQRRKDRAPVAPVARRGLTDAAMALDESRMDPQLMGAMACREALCQLSDKFNSGWSSSPPWEQPQPSGSFPQQPLTPGSKCSQFDGDRNNRGAANAGLCTIDAAAFAHKEADSEVTPTLAAAPMAVGPHMEMACAAEGISENLQFVHEGPTSGSSHVDAEAVVRTGAISDRHAGAGKDVQQEAAAKKAPGTTMERTDTVAQPSTPQPVGRPTQLAVRWAVLEGGPGSAVPQPPPEELDADVDHEKDPRVVRTKLVYLLLAACFTQLTGRWSTSRSSLLQLAVAAAAAAIELLSYHHTFLAVNGISAEAARRLFGKGRLSSRAQYQWVLLRPEEGMPPPLEDGRKEVKARPSLPRAGDLGPPLALSFVPCSRRVDRRWRSLRRRAARLRSNDRVFSYTIRSTWIDADTPAGATWSSPTSCTSEPAISSSRHAADSTQQWLESHLGSGALTRFICEGRDALAAVTLGIARAQAAARRRGCCFLVAPSLFEETLNSTLVRESAKSFLRGYIDIVRMPGTGAVPGSSAQGAPSCSGENEESEDTRSSSSDDDDHDTSGDETVIGVRGNGNAIARGKRRNRFGGGGTLLTSEMSLRVCEGWRNLRLVSFNRAVSTLMALEPNQAALLLGGEALREATVGSIGATATTGDCRTTDSGRYNISASAGDDGADGRNVTKCKAEGRWDGDEDGAGRRHRILFDEIEDMCLRQGVLRLTPSTGIHLEVLEVPFADLDEVETEGRATPGVSRTSCG